jgi:uncharacterized membrane protein
MLWAVLMTGNSRKNEPHNTQAFSGRTPTPIDNWIPGRSIGRLIETLFVDSTFWYSCWSCHRLPCRSLSIYGRQFSICARCTGLVIGVTLLPLTVYLYSRADFLPLFGMALFFLDGGTQALGMRRSRNSWRLLTGIAFPGAVLTSFLGVLG